MKTDNDRIGDGEAVAVTDQLINLTSVRALQAHTGAAFRHRAGQLVAQAVREVTDYIGLDGDNQRAPTGLGNTLRDEGYANLGAALEPPQVARILEHFRARPCYNAHVVAKSDGVARRRGGEAEAFHYGSYTLPDVVSAPYLLELANRPDILAGVQDYLGCLPTLYSLHAWWSFPGHGKASVSQEFHRDLDDFKFCAMFVYLTDVGPSTSPHQFIRRSHRPELVEAAIAKATERLQQAGIKFSLADFYGDAQGYGRDDLYRLLFDGCVDTICGPAGTAFIADTIGLHKVIPPVEGPRLMFWARYGLYRNTGNAGDHLEPLSRESVGPRLPPGPRSACINRCIVSAG